MSRISKIDSLSKMVADWVCVNLNENDTLSCPGKVTNWSYYDLVIRGSPVCPVCDDDMVCILTSANILPEDSILGY